MVTIDPTRKPLPEHLYEKVLGPVRFAIRQGLLNHGCRDTKLLCDIQSGLRCKVLDYYFLGSGVLGNHLTFVLVLPSFFLFNLPDVGRVMSSLLLYGVVVSSALKDYLCIPRPQSPPVHRLSISKAHGLEYGFPSSHTTNCVALGLASLSYISSSEAFSFHTQILLITLTVVYMTSVSFGRIYCGMHSVMDVTGGFVLAVGLWIIFYLCQEYVDQVIFHSGILSFALTITGLLSMIYLNPEPLDPCPCFEDSAACIGAIIGIYIGTWGTIHDSSYLTDFSAMNCGYVQLVMRLLLGLGSIIISRTVMKKVCRFCLPPIYQILNIPTHIPVQTRSAVRRMSISIIPPPIDIENNNEAKSTIISTGKTLHSSNSKLNCRESKPNNKDMNKVDSDVLKAYRESIIPRYDIDILTKVLVYTVMGWFASQGNLILCKLLSI
ncbi:Long-chain base-1-phosphate phosphatase [Basidiobolus ranarum]|uniref:Long-chain base-1-phosphate phosphatase n=1 Tax=Basidiobolus ranarum TaxID=34480 RepID=A0ABR2VS52_9FUNG